MTKYHAVKTTLDGYVFDSKAEAARYQQLLLLVKAGEIEGLQVHPIYPLVVNNQRIGKYIGDFMYFVPEKDSFVLEDVKGVRTAVYRLKKRLVKALYNVDILETQPERQAK